ncbi:hypothetical protein LJB88_01280 [Erysipelotrichaceae bacterium OttesenSCG-928-M19]|nr:hypothetical protein [Erysipelotrichaceae bacterium OttesenSCG-928-M19]
MKSNRYAFLLLVITLFLLTCTSLLALFYFYNAIISESITTYLYFHLFIIVIINVLALISFLIYQGYKTNDKDYFIVPVIFFVLLTIITFISMKLILFVFPIVQLVLVIMAYSEAKFCQDYNRRMSLKRLNDKLVLSLSADLYHNEIELINK